MSFQELREKDQKYIANTYNRFPADIVRGEGATLYSEDGKKFVDFGSGIVMACTVVVIILAADAPMSYFVRLAFAALSALGALILSAPYRMATRSQPA